MSRLLLRRTPRQPLWRPEWTSLLPTFLPMLLPTLILASPAQADTLAAALAAPQPAPPQQRIQLDGVFDEPLWQQATVFDTSYQVVPATHRSDSQKMQVKTLATADGIYVGITNFQAKGQRQKQYNLQDGFMQADFNSIVIDFAGDGTAAYLFSMTLGGGIQDAAMTPQLTTDYDWDGVWQVAHAETDDYWTSEFFLPWQSVSFRHRLQASGLSKIGVSVQLYDLSKNFVYGTQPQSMARSDFYLNMPKLSWAVPAQARWQWLPYITSHYDGIKAQQSTDVGFDVSYKPNHHQQLSVAVNPDFGQVDSDELVLNYSNVETLLTDKRPFFTQDLSFFSTLSLQDSLMLHTRRIGAGSDDGQERITPIDAAVRFTHLGEAVNVGAFAVQENSLDSDSGKSFYVGRTTYRSEQWQTGLLATRTERPYLARQANTVTWDSQYQSETWSWQSAVAQSQVHDEVSTHEREAGTHDAASDTQGLAWWLAGKYQFTPRFDVGMELFRLDNQFDNSDLGYMQRNNWRYHALISNYAHSPALPGINRIKHKATLSYQANDSGLKLNAKQDYLVTLSLDNGGQIESQLLYQTAGWQDNIGYQSDAFYLPSAWSRRVMYISPYVGTLTWAASLQLDDQGLDGLARQYGLDLTWLPHPNWTVNFNQFYREGDGWLIANQRNHVSSYDSDFYASTLKVSSLLTDDLELGINLQWALLSAQTQQVYQVTQGALQTQTGLDTSFDDQRLTAQFKLRYKLGAYSDLYLVYNRAGVHDIDDTAPKPWLSDISAKVSELWQHPVQDLWTAKIRYAF